MDWKLIVQHLPLYLKGAVVTMELTIASMFLGVAAGLLIITLRLGRVRILRIAASRYTITITDYAHFLRSSIFRDKPFTNAVRYFGTEYKLGGIYVRNF